MAAGKAAAPPPLLARASWCSLEVREEEGIRQLEEDDAVVKEVSSEYPIPRSAASVASVAWLAA